MRPLFALTASLVLLTSCSSSVAADLNTTVVREVETPLPLLRGTSLDGAALSTADYAGSVMVINAWATWCNECEIETPQLVLVANAYADRGVVFLGIDHGDQEALARRFVQRYDVPYPSFSDPSGRFAAQLGYFTLPDTYIVDTTGTVRYVLNGATTQAQLSALLDTVLGSASAQASP